MDIKKKNVVDVSRFFIFEATGDSEADKSVDPNKATSTTIDRDGEDNVDDAESCSHDDDDDDSSDDNFSFANNSSRNNRVNGSFHDNVQVCILDDKEEEGDEAHSYYPTWPHDPHNNNNNGRKNSSHEEELLSEMEKNKLFWETCLAS